MARKRLRSSTSASTSAAPPPKRAACSVLELPEELIREILSRVPVKSLFRFRCVCKSWDSLFHDPQFLKKQANSAPRQFMRLRTNQSIESFPVSTPCQGQYIRLPTPRTHSPGRGSVKIVGCCNGLVCLRALLAADEIIYFWNPVTNQSTKLPHTFSLYYIPDVRVVAVPVGNGPPRLRRVIDEKVRHCNIFGFGFDDSINEFKLVRIFVQVSELGSKWAVQVYGVGEGSGKPIPAHPFHSGTLSPLENVGVCLNGILHWGAASISKESNTKSWVIIALDIAKETFRQVPLPEENVGSWDGNKLYCVGESLCFMASYKASHDDVWIMKEYGVKESWTMLITIQREPLSSMNSRLPSLPLYFSETNGDELLMIYEGKLRLYNLREESFHDVGVSRVFKCCDSSTYYIYAESLFIPGMTMGGEPYKKYSRFHLIRQDKGAGVRTWSIGRPKIDAQESRLHLRGG